MASRAFMQILIGLLIVAFDVTLDITVARTDVLFDVLGYVLILVACANLATQRREFIPAKVVTAVAVLLSVPQMFGVDPAGFVSAGLRACDVLMIWFVCSGIIRMALDRGQTDFARTTTNVRLWTLIVGIVAWTLALIARVAPPVAFVAAVPLMVVTFVLGIAFLVVLHRASVEFA